MMENVIIYQDPNVALRRKMTANADVMAALEPVERAVFLASVDKSFGEMTGNEIAVEIAKAVKFISKDVGYKCVDDAEMGYTIVRVAEIVKRYYPMLTLRDFRMAFEMTIAGGLDEYLPKGRDGQPDRGHYQQFNAEYVCKVLNAYRMRRAAIIRKANDALPAVQQAPEPEQIREYRNRVRGDLIMAFHSYRDTGKMGGWTETMMMLFHEELASVGLADEIIVTPDEQRAILDATINRYMRMGNKMDVQRLQVAGLNAREIQFDSFVLARKKAVEKTFDRLIADGTDIEKYIKFEQDGND